MIRGGWAYRLAPLAGELLSSCLARNAHAHGLSAYRFLNLFWDGDPVWSRDFDRDPGGLNRAGRRPAVPDWLDDVAVNLGVERSAVEAATLAPWRRRLAEGRPARFGDTPLVLSAGVHHRTRRRHALQFCPDCLQAGVPHFRKEWRLGFVTWCAAHRRPLRDACPRCGAPVIPHRSMTTNLTDCHQCGKAITDGCRGAEPPIPETTTALQARLLGALQGVQEAGGDAWAPRNLFDAVRALLAVSAARPVHAALRGALGLGEPPAGEGERLRFEHTRSASRIPWLETVAALLANWPASFRSGADAAGLTRRTFARTRPGARLAAEIARLPLGQRRDRTWVPLLEEPVLRRLRRTDPAAYRAERARRILDATGFAP